MELVVKVVPRSRKTELAGQMADGAWKIRLAAVPENNQANEALCAFLAAHFHVPRSAVKILSGATATRKRIQIEK